MSGYKHIETAIARFICIRYHRVAEAGAGYNIHAAKLIQRAGLSVFCVDLLIPTGILPVLYVKGDVTNPDYSLFTGVECIYTIRPVEEMMYPLILLARQINADLIVYHLGYEQFPYPSIIVDHNIPLRRYVTRQN